MSNHVKPIILIIISNYPTGTQSSATEFSESRAWKNMPDGEKGNRHGYSSHPPHIKSPPQEPWFIRGFPYFLNQRTAAFFHNRGMGLCKHPHHQEGWRFSPILRCQMCKDEIPKLNKERSRSRKNHQTLCIFFSANHGIHCQMVSFHSRKSDISR